MLKPSEKELILDALDGRVTVDDQTTLETLLLGSAEASQLYELLLKDQSALRELPRYTAPPELHRNVVYKLSLSPYSIVAAAERKQFSLSSIFPYILAASVFFTVVSTSYVVFCDNDQSRQIVQSSREKDIHSRATSQRDHRAADTGFSLNSAVETLPTPRAVTNSTDNALATRPSTIPALIPAPRESAADLVASGRMSDWNRFDTIMLNMPFLSNIADIDEQHLSALLNQDFFAQPVRIDLFAIDSSRAAEILRRVCSRCGIQLTVEPLAQERISKRLASSYLLYSDSLTANEIAKILITLKSLILEADQGLVSNVHIYPFHQGESRDLKDLLGIDIVHSHKFKPSSSSDSSKISSSTAETIEKHIARKHVLSQRSAVLVNYYPVLSRANYRTSKAIQQFLQSRSSSQPGTIPLIICIRHPS